MRSKTISMSPYTAASAVNVAASQTPAAGGVQSLTLTSNPVTLDQPRQVSIASAGNDSARVWVVEGTDRKGNFRIEAVAGGNAVPVQTVMPFKTVTAIRVDGNTAGAVTAGTTTIVDSDWVPVDSMMKPFGAALVLDIPAGNAGMNFTVQMTSSRLGRGADVFPPISMDHLASKFGLIFPPLLVFPHATFTAIVATGQVVGNIIVPVMAIRLRSTTVFTGTAVRLGIDNTGVA